ncbi:helix-turn-helix transcriptional regulator [Tenacibaculum finnmarkense genomovar ulcerans]|uniref:helix-turn-helix domain-containing protein n=1 Tax=Tenacibaculum finnmarkense TaxID=2781243 RepID=UPI001E6292E1|nr:helix-turn-helix transcriptional regulator [Tenacibaculum finnmarkense]MCD8433362.1 helix-turn-helix transcriptional regulator [Tenacibaculum finnmarkense genomovar ulcerans]
MLDVKSIIKSKGYTVTLFAEKLGMSQVSLSRIINGNPTIETLQKIADVLDVDIKELFVSTKDGSSKIQVIINDKLKTFATIEDFKIFANSL